MVIVTVIRVIIRILFMMPLQQFVIQYSSMLMTSKCGSTNIASIYTVTNIFLKKTH